MLFRSVGSGAAARMQFRWPATGAAHLQVSTKLAGPWADVPNVPAPVGGWYIYEVPIPGALPSQFYRLR